MAQHITIVLANGGAVHHHGDAMYDGDEGILVVDMLEQEATANYPVKEGYVVSWITSPMSKEEERIRLDAAARGEDPDDDGVNA